ncbi:flavodoxin family protein [Zeaxanthinibacter enoshimensis]|uniref:Flavodoxin n=1 Tax=Zeaxanthinibacter enoshimensis TaxID=392009 RepID=A0A4R6TPA3_9FLAO|nr:flavodoxin [Zeaxanthinibacter enoshimensis]TDQ31191.1 flavodoxin [Zeaxanthinibacter enoshimensis]
MLKKIHFLIYLLVTISFFAQNKGVISEDILIVYLSRTNNTKAIAELIQEQLGGDLVAIELETPYPEDYDAIVKQVARENATGYLPPLKTRIDLDKYSTIFIGFPTWGMQLPPPVKSFLVNNDLGGKTVVPFNTNAGYGVGSSFRTVNELCVDCKILKGFQIKGGVERDGILLAIKDEKREQARKLVQAWLAEISPGIPR